jgi:hypothetical protein
MQQAVVLAATATPAAQFSANSFLRAVDSLMASAQHHLLLAVYVQLAERPAFFKEMFTLVAAAWYQALPATGTCAAFSRHSLEKWPSSPHLEQAPLLETLPREHFLSPLCQTCLDPVQV